MVYLSDDSFPNNKIFKITGSSFYKNQEYNICIYEFKSKVHGSGDSIMTTLSWFLLPTSSINNYQLLIKGFSKPIIDQVLRSGDLETLK